MLELSPRQRILVTDTLKDAANIMLAGFFVGQFVGNQPFSVRLALVGAAIWAGVLGWNMFLTRGHRP